MDTLPSTVSRNMGDTPKENTVPNAGPRPENADHSALTAYSDPTTHSTADLRTSQNSEGGKSPAPFTLVIYGASGNLTKRKLVPALAQLFAKGQLPKDFRIAGVARKPMSSEEWFASLKNPEGPSDWPAEWPTGWEKTETESPKENADPQIPQSTLQNAPQNALQDGMIWRNFARHMVYASADGTSAEDMNRLGVLLDAQETSETRTRIFYLATSPDLYQPILRALTPEVYRLREKGVDCRIVVEKPFGVDLETAKELNAALRSVFPENRIYRIDHYLGKETARNLLVLRFANSIFEPLWNRQFIDHVQITASEDALVGHRAAYFNRAGILRDMFQNHLLQLLALTAMEAPASLDAESIRNEKVKVLQAIRPFHSPEEVRERTIRGQYIPDTAYGSGETKDALEPSTPTFAAMELQIENWRWSGVPFYLRSGKGMGCRTTQILMRFRKPPHLLFPKTETCAPNSLLIQLQPAEGIQLGFVTKVPDTEKEISHAAMSFTFARHYRDAFPEAYERLLLDVVLGDLSLFIRGDETEIAWKIMDPIQNAWDEHLSGGDPPEFPAKYEIGSWGPEESDTWMESRGQQWFNVCPVLPKPFGK